MVTIRSPYHFEATFAHDPRAPRIAARSDDGIDGEFCGEARAFVMPTHPYGGTTDVFAVPSWELTTGQRFFVPAAGAVGTDGRPVTPAALSVDAATQPGAWWTVTAQPYDASEWRAVLAERDAEDAERVAATRARVVPLGAFHAARLGGDEG